MAFITRPRPGRGLRLAVAGGVLLTALTAATATAAPPTPMGVQAGAGPRTPTPGFLLDQGHYSTIEVPGATVETGVGGINNRGQIVGGARAPGAAPGRQPEGHPPMARMS